MRCALLLFALSACRQNSASAAPDPAPSVVVAVDAAPVDECPCDNCDPTYCSFTNHVAYAWSSTANTLAIACAQSIKLVSFPSRTILKRIPAKPLPERLVAKGDDFASVADDVTGPILSSDGAFRFELDGSGGGLPELQIVSTKKVRKVEKLTAHSFAPAHDPRGVFVSQSAALMYVDLDGKKPRELHHDTDNHPYHYSDLAVSHDDRWLVARMNMISGTRVIVVDVVKGAAVDYEGPRCRKEL